ncbi:uncharacterized protein PHACADRAFT_198788 [Phanerochaete carnosa HHB-10118-sp]|uniref:AMP-dependent synthetase/ligase domain-containing protein n=1 Tax=Phanerochaete carnosa (strain HHB-10118-sp) TaxID=650164 RepID=K5W1G7_PHACS|nr:uncharacterized protein PHACADRAFT_198788 [Phanerochaete carnosa HHB-10118-sp]EKM52739.1 hypothetical protein PHACADRAFT_198788 [Phanerochaete carnosa HHB-10118-sp]
MFSRRAFDTYENLFIMFKIPLLDSSLCLAQQFDWQAEHSPHRPLFDYVNDDGSLVSIDYATAQYAVHRGARSVLSALKEAGISKTKEKPVVAFVSAAESITYATFGGPDTGTY